MTNVIQFPTVKQIAINQTVPKTGIKFRKKRYNIAGIEVDPPKDRFEYLELCKKFLSETKYRDVLCGICDKEIYNTIHPALQKLVDNYYMLDVK